MKIPMGNFGGVIAQPQQEVQVRGNGAVADALGNVGNAIGNIAQAGQQAELEKQREQFEMGRIKGSNVLLDHDIWTKEKTRDLSDRIVRGEVSYKDADDVFRKEISSQPLPAVDGLHATDYENLQRGFKRNIFGAETALRGVVEGAQRADYKGQFGAALDKLGKLAGMPGADIEKINQQAEPLIPLAKKAGIPEDAFGKTIQDWRDKNWTNQAVQRAMESKDDIEKIGQLERDLTASDGFYANKIDTDKRNSVLRTVINDRLRIENRQQHDADRREVKAEKVIVDVDRQISSGVPMTPDMVLTWGEKVKGTSFEGDFKDRLQDETQVQQVLRLPIDQQAAFVQQKEAKLLAGGGTVREKTNLDRLKVAVDRNTKQLQEEPLIFAQNRMGQEAKPVDFSKLLEPDGAVVLGGQMAERVATIAALQKQFGPQVKMHPLLPQEAELISKGLDHATPQQQARLFGTLRASFNDDTAYTATMQQIAADSPVKALAGALFAKQRGITLERKWFGTDSVAQSTDVAETLLVGDSIVNKSKGQKAEDGAGKSLNLPPRNAFQAEFASAAGDLYRNGRTKDQEIDLQAAYTYYVGRASQVGRLTANATDIDSGLVKEALAATVGEPINFNGRGMVTAPWGMSKDTFNAHISNAFARTVKEHGLPESMTYQFENYGLTHYRGSTYMPTLGGAPLINPKTGKPIVLEVLDAPVYPGTGIPR